VWQKRGKPIGAGFAPPLLALLGHRSDSVRRAAGAALAGGLAEQQQQGQAGQAGQQGAAMVVARLLQLFFANPDPVGVQER